jgi:hypothetical protein
MSGYIKCKNLTTDPYGQNGQKHGIETTGPRWSVSVRGKILLSSSSTFSFELTAIAVYFAVSSSSSVRVGSCSSWLLLPYGRLNRPYGRISQPYGRMSQPYGRMSQPYGRMSQPYGRMS